MIFFLPFGPFLGITICIAGAEHPLLHKIHIRIAAITEIHAEHLYIDFQQILGYLIVFGLKRK